MDKKTTTVTVFNEQYSLTSNLPKEETEAIAAMVDSKMQQLAEKTHVVKTGRVAVWAALDFAGLTPFTWAAKPLAHASMPAILTEKK